MMQTNTDINLKLRLLVIAVTAMFLSTLGMMVFILVDKDSDAATTPGTALPVSKGGTGNNSFMANNLVGTNDGSSFSSIALPLSTANGGTGVDWSQPVTTLYATYTHGVTASEPRWTMRTLYPQYVNPNLISAGEDFRLPCYGVLEASDTFPITLAQTSISGALFVSDEITLNLPKNLTVTLSDGSVFKLTNIDFYFRSDQRNRVVWASQEEETAYDTIRIWGPVAITLNSTYAGILYHNSICYWTKQ